MTYDYATSNERVISGAVAFTMHALFFVMLVIGVHWQKKEPDSAVIVDLWNNLPPVPQAEPAPAPAPKPEPPAPKPQPKPEPRPEPKPAPVPKAEPKPAPKPDIALKEREEKERRQKEQEKAEAKKRQEELARQEALKQKQAQEAEAKRLAQEQADAQKKIAAQAAAAASAQQKQVDEYKRRIADKIRRFIVEPPGVNPAAQVEFEITVIPGGEVLGAKLKRAANSNPAYDAAVERAIIRAQPLPVPQDPTLMREFRELNLVFRPKE